MSYKITLLPGDGIGPEVTDAAVKVLNFVAAKFSAEISYEEKLMGGCSYDEYGTPLDEAKALGSKKAIDYLESLSK